MKLPKFLQKYAAEAKEMPVGEVEFSGPTYQVQVGEFWAFLQLESKGNIKDSFCSCEDGDACAHIAAAYLRIFSGHKSALHHRFNRSLWNQLCQLYAEYLGTDPEVLEEVEPGYFVCRSEGEIVFYVRGDSQKLRQLVEERPVETEETSLKFSNLSYSEIELWRKGRPSIQLRYELSFWNDLAKWLMLLQDSGEKYDISFKFSDKKLPNEIKIHFSEVEIGFSLSEAYLPFIIPALSTVESPLKVHQMQQDAFEKISYDQQAGVFFLQAKGISEQILESREKEGIVFDGWVFVPKDGFYPKDQHRLLESPVISEEKINGTLNEHYPVIKPLLKGAVIHLDPVSLSYTIEFDEEWQLHLTAYLFTPGDLSHRYSKLFGDWAYLEDDGFYPVEGVKFNGVETVISQKGVQDFVREHRVWLNSYEAFQTHIVSLETQLSYSVNNEGFLTFSRQEAFDEESPDTKDFGQWVYVRGEGFYSKITQTYGLPVTPGTMIHPAQVPQFIRKNSDELSLISGFFSDHALIEKAGLRVVVTDKGMINITPEYTPFAEYSESKILFFEEYVYIEEKGFHEMLGDARLPDLFRHPIDVKKENVPHFIGYELDLIRNFATYIDPRLQKPKSLKLVAEYVEQDETGYGLNLSYVSSRGKIKFSQIFTGIQKRQRFIFSDAGLIDLEDPRFRWVRSVKKDQMDRRKNRLSQSTMELLRLLAFEKLEVKDGEHFIQELVEYRTQGDPDLTGMEGMLRPYQELGVRWLWYLYTHNLSGLLCDEMGLGKTHQSMALLVAVKNLKGTKGKFLVVCPTSVIYHWEEKLKKYFPEAVVNTYHGVERQLDEYDILLTSYGIWRREFEKLKKHSFDVAIFDEIQVAKNASSRIFITLNQVKAKMRLGLTGTPIENRLRELKSLFDLVLPNYMLPETEYREFFAKPIEKYHNQERMLLLTKFIKPFILRRKKNDVLTDLPEKIEEIAHCDLSPDQTLLYNEVLHKMRSRVLNELSDDKNPVPYIHIFAILSALKQICNHPAAYLKVPQEYENYTSGKWELFVELLNEARESGQKVVIFSQYLAMLDIMEQHLKKHGIGFASIRGATVERGKEIHRFNEDSKCEVFLGSLQAAGWGIDLTAASVVIHYDRWWNAAREDQATDRVHRIGQTRGVQVFKLVTKGSFEERIDTLISQKGKLMEEVVGIDNHQFVKKFSREEIIQLLQDVH